MTPIEESSRTAAAGAATSGPPSAWSSSSRAASIDLIRGAVMILMAIDHVRVYSGVPAGGPAPGVFFTRWITHFCAPAFVFLAGTSAFFYGRKHADLSRFLLIRGAWLVLLELTVIRIGWTFNLDFAHYMLAGVIWVIGWSMIMMAVLVKLPVAAVGTIGVVVIACHNLLDSVVGGLIPTLNDRPLGWLWKILYVGFFAGPVQIGADGPNLMVLYSIVPWIGVMAAGYGFGAVLALPPARRNRICLAIGVGAVLLFFVLRGSNFYGDPRPWGPASVGGGAPGGPPPMPVLLSFLNTTKYPASLVFLLMTLGPTIALIPLLERVAGGARTRAVDPPPALASDPPRAHAQQAVEAGSPGRLARAVSVFGRVPFFFYLLHIPLIHTLALVVSKIRLGEVSPWLFENHPMGSPPPPDGYRWSLPLLYAVWAVAIALLYFSCRWFADLKARRRDWWLRYL